MFGSHTDVGLAGFVERGVFSPLTRAEAESRLGWATGQLGGADAEQGGEQGWAKARQCEKDAGRGGTERIMGGEEAIQGGGGGAMIPGGAEARLGGTALGVCHLRFLPKSATALRPISNLSRAPPPGVAEVRAHAPCMCVGVGVCV